MITSSMSDFSFIASVTACTAMGFVGVLIAGFAFYRMQKRRFAAQQVDYPRYGITGPSKKRVSLNSQKSNGAAPSDVMDAKLASSAELYHYHQAKQQIVAMDKNSTVRNRPDESCDSDSDTEQGEGEGSVSVYECPGLAPISNVELNNPLYHDLLSPASKETSEKDIPPTKQWNNVP